MVKANHKKFFGMKQYICGSTYKSKEKVFPNCNDTIYKTPTLGNWKTVTVECKGKCPGKL